MRVPIRSTGGWADLWYDWTPRLHSHAGFGLDDRVNGDFLFGRTYNQFIFANALFDVTESSAPASSSPSGKLCIRNGAAA